MGAALDSAAALATGERAAMLASMDALPTATARADALGQLSARSYSLLPRLSIQSMDAADREIQRYLVERHSIAMDAPFGVPAQGHEKAMVAQRWKLRATAPIVRGALGARALARIQG